MSIEFSPTRVTAISTGNGDRLVELLDAWFDAPDDRHSYDVDARSNRVKVHREGNQNPIEVRDAVISWVADKRRLHIDEFSVHEYPWTIEIWRRFEIELREDAYVGRFVDAVGEYKVTGANGVEIGSISVRPAGWVGTSRSIDSAIASTTTDPRDTPREAFAELLSRLGFTV